MPSTLEFIEDCVRLNRPCIFKGLTVNWPLFQDLHSAIPEQNILKNIFGS